MKVFIDITTRANNKGIREAERGLKRLERLERKGGIGAMAGGGGLSRKQTKLNDKSLDEMNKSWLKFFNTLNKGFFKAIGVMTKFTAVSSGLLSAALGAITVGFKVGELAIKAWRVGLAAAAATAAAAAAVITGFFAAQRQYQGAMNALNYSAGPLGNRQEQAIGALKQLQSDSDLAVFGLEAVGAAFAGIGRNAAYTGNMKVALKSLGDFAVASGDMEKGLAAAGEFLGVLAKEGKLNQKAQAAGAGLGVEFQEAMKEAVKRGAVSEDAFLAALNSGELNKKVAGLLDGVNNTLMGRIKGFGTEMKSLFSDLGQSFLPEAEVGFERMGDIIRSAVIRIGASMQGFAEGPLLKGLITATEKISDLTVNLFDEYLPKSEGMFSKLQKWLRGIGSWFNYIKDALEPLKEAGTVLWDALKPIFKGAAGGFLDSLRTMANDLMANRGAFVSLGESVGNLVRSLSRMFSNFRGVIISALPTIKNLVDNIAAVVDKLASLFGFFGGTTDASGKRSGGMGSNAAMLLLGALGFGKMFGGQILGSKGFKDRVLGNEVRTSVTTYGPNGETITKTRTGREKGFAGTKTGGFLSPKRVTARDAAGRPTQYGGMRYGAMASAGLLAGSMFASPEMAPYMQAASLGAYMPGPAGAILAGGALLAGSTKSRTVGGGIMTGAGGGAALGGGIGSLIAPGVGTAIGAAIGAVVGGLIGGIKGAVNNTKDEAKRTREVGVNFGNSIKSTLVDGFAANLDPSEIRTRLGEQGSFYNKLSGMTTELQNIYLRPGFSASSKEGGKFYKGEADLKATGYSDYVMQKRREFSQRTGQDPYALDLRTIATEEQFKTDINSRIKEFRRNRDALLEQGINEGWINKEDASWFRSQIMSYDKAPDAKKQAAIDKKMREVLANGMKVLGEGERIAGINLDRLSKATGKSTEELTKLATDAGVSLYDNTLNVVEAMKKMGIQIPQTMDQFKRALVKNWVDSAQTVFDEVFAPLKAGETIDQAAEEFRGLKGKAPVTMIGDFMKTLAEQAAIMFPNDPEKMREFFFGNIGVGGKQFTDPTSPLYGREKEFTTGAAGEFQKRFDQEIQTKNAAVSTTVLQDYLNNQTGGNFGVSAEVANKFFAGKSIKEQGEIVARLQKANEEFQNRRKMYKLQRPGANDEELNILARQGLSNDAKSALEAVGLANTDLVNGIQDWSTTFFEGLNKDQQAMYTAIVNAMKLGNAAKPEWYTKGPDWWSKGLVISAGKGTTVNVTAGAGGSAGTGTAANANDWDGDGIPNLIDRTPGTNPGGDTTSARLARTLSRHRQLNGMVAGKRTVTSSYRNDMLGSINSDHLTGNAYDLTGQNLGAYQSLVNNSGGFAEFHGAGGSRHLHVVPGPGLPAGDSATPALMTAPMGAPAAGPSTFNITVNGGNASPEQIAQVVMQRIEQKQRSIRERS